MRLVNTRTLRLEEFRGADIPQYAILSHTWGSEEMSFHQMQSRFNQFRKGFTKIQIACRQALKDNISYVWIDTCCIDKSSSAELTEAVNSMFGYYRNSVVCYAFLSDLDSSTDTEVGLEQCRWFTRGWTLQELIAPKEVRFYDSKWQFRGTKNDLLETISRITHVGSSILRWTTSRTDGLRLTFAAEKVSWISHRETTRVEDMAYCLLGIFDINMPLLYGEGTRAFRRLQEEILAKHGDLSILAWKPMDEKEATTLGILAKSASEFDWIRESNMCFREHVVQKECVLTSRGLRLNFRLSKYEAAEAAESISPPYFRYVMDLGFWAETPDTPTEDSNDAVSPNVPLVSVATKIISSTRAKVVSFGILLRKYGPSLYCRDIGGLASSLVELSPFEQLPKCPTETAFLYANRDYTPLAYWNAASDSFSEIAVHFPKQPELDIVAVANGLYWDSSNRVLLCWHDLSHISSDWDIVTVRPSPTIYGTSDILLLVGPLWLPARTRVRLLDEGEQTQYVLEHISEFYGLNLPNYSELPWASETRQESRTMDGKWSISCQCTRKIVEGISRHSAVLCVELSLSPAGEN